MHINIRVMLVDDHNVIRSGLRRLLEMGGDIQVVAEASTGEQACAIYDDNNIDVVVMDLSMPGMGGLEAFRYIHTKYPRSKVVIFTMHENVTFATRLLSEGAYAYVTKSSSADDLLNAVREVVMGNTYISANISQKIAIQSIHGEDDPIEKLTERERAVFKLLVEGKNVDEVAKALNIGYKTAANYQSLIKQKLGISSIVELVHFAIRQGIILE
jgi:two-component system invasion response regulator UvrY